MDDAVRTIIEKFGLTPHPEGGFYSEVYRASTSVTHPGVPPEYTATRPSGTLIYYLLAGDDFSAFHRVKWSDEIWHLYAGGPLELHVVDAQQIHATQTLSTDLGEGEPTSIVPAGHWQAARLAPGAQWAFGGCTVAPGFEFADFEMPPRAKLIDLLPKLTGLIRELTHD